MRVTGRKPAVVLLLVVLAAAGAAFASDERVGSEILFETVPGVAGADIATRYGCTLVDGIPEWSVWSMAAPTPQDVDPIVAQMLLDPQVLDAEAHRAFETPEGVQRTIGDLDRTITSPEFRGQPAAQLVRTTAAHAVQTGFGVTVAVLDSGMSLGHPDMGSRILANPGANFAGGGPLPVPSPDGIDNDGDGTADEGVEHATLVAGLVNLAAPNARILAVRVLDEEGRGTSFSLVKGVLYAVRHGADVLNLSLGMAQRSGLVKKAVDKALDAGIVVVAAAGNRGLDDIDFPARLDGVIAVAAVDELMTSPGWSNHHSKVDLTAPAVKNISTYGSDAFGRWDGTSFAAPLVSGAAALLLERYPGLRPDEVRNVLRDTTQPDANPPGMDGQFGTGVLDLDAVARVVTGDRSSLRKSRSGASSTVTFSPVAGAAHYDIVRGDVANLALAGIDVSLGPVACIADSITDTTASDAAVPAPGQAFFFVFRDDALWGGSYGNDSAGRTRQPGAGDCAAR